jgi:hypothetical protein
MFGRWLIGLLLCVLLGFVVVQALSNSLFHQVRYVPCTGCHVYYPTVVIYPSPTVSNIHHTR